MLGVVVINNKPYFKVGLIAITQYLNYINIGSNMNR